MLAELEEALDLRGGDACDGELGEAVAREELGGARLGAERRPLVACELAEEEGLPRVPDVWLLAGAVAVVSVAAPVVEREQPVGTDGVARLLQHLARDGDARALADVRPAARKRPAAAVRELADEQDPVVAEDAAAHVELRRRVPLFRYEDLFPPGGGAVAGDHLGGDPPHLGVTIAVVLRRLAVGEARLGDRLEPARPVEERRHHCAPAGADRRTLVISSQSSRSSSVGRPRVTGPTSGSAKPSRP